MGAQGTIIYRLVMKNLSYDAYFSFLIFQTEIFLKISKLISHLMGQCMLRLGIMDSNYYT